MKNVALFGAGRIGRIHGSNIAALPGVKLKYVCDPFGDSAAQLAQALGAQVGTADAVFADASIEVVAVGSPTDTHSDLIARAAASKKHIFCEKPIDLSVARAQACADAVKAAGIACMIGFQRRFDPTFNEAKERLVRGTERSIGFSQKMCFFAAAARVSRSLWVSVGAPIATTSIAGSANTVSGVATLAPSCTASCAALSPTGSQTYFSFTPGSPAMLWPWIRPMRPAPKSATCFMGSPEDMTRGGRR